ncbi:MAG: hypothetical protein IPM29_22820 [Planctomycetes bacterium]|nr:hypothetical protein [Planctomycetota bacterium]
MGCLLIAGLGAQDAGARRERFAFERLAAIASEPVTLDVAHPEPAAAALADALAARDVDASDAAVPSDAATELATVALALRAGREFIDRERSVSLDELLNIARGLDAVLARDDAGVRDAIARGLLDQLRRDGEREAGRALLRIAYARLAALWQDRLEPHARRAAGAPLTGDVPLAFEIVAAGAASGLQLRNETGQDLHRVTLRIGSGMAGLDRPAEIPFFAFVPVWSDGATVLLRDVVVAAALQGMALRSFASDLSVTVLCDELSIERVDRELPMHEYHVRLEAGDDSFVLPLRRAIPDRDALHRELGQHWRRCDQKHAIEVLETLRAAQPGEPVYALLLGQVCGSVGSVNLSPRHWRTGAEELKAFLALTEDTAFHTDGAVGRSLAALGLSLGRSDAMSLRDRIADEVKLLAQQRSPVLLACPDPASLDKQIGTRTRLAEIRRADLAEAEAKLARAQDDLDRAKRDLADVLRQIEALGGRRLPRIYQRQRTDCHAAVQDKQRVVDRLEREAARIRDDLVEIAETVARLERARADLQQR